MCMITTQHSPQKESQHTEWEAGQQVESIFNLNSHFGRFPHSSTGAQKAGGAYLINRSGENDWQERVEEHAILEFFFISCQLCFLASYIILNSLSATPGSFE